MDRDREQPGRAGAWKNEGLCPSAECVVTAGGTSGDWQTGEALCPRHLRLRTHCSCSRGGRPPQAPSLLLRSSDGSPCAAAGLERAWR